MAESTLLRWSRNTPRPELKSAGGWSSIDQTRVWPRGLIADRDALPDSATFDTDSELLVALFEHSGTDALEMMAGTQSVALWDAKNRELLVSTDRAGVHPMFYTKSGDRTLVSSDVVNLLEEPSVTRRLNIRSCVRFLQGEPPGSGETFFDGVLAVEPARILKLSSSGVVDESIYWELDPQPVLPLSRREDYENAYLERLSEVIPGYLPKSAFGITLSGGLDSTSVAAIARASRSGGDIVGFTWIAPELPEADEHDVAEAAAAHLGIELVPIRGDLHWPLSSPLGLATSPDGPFLNFYSELWDETFRTMRGKGFDVSLSGLDGDRLFGGGLFPYADLLLTGRWLTLVNQVRHHLRHVTKSLPSLLRQTVLSPVARAYLPPLRHRARPVPWLKTEFREPVAKDRGTVWRGLPGRFNRYETLTDPFLGMVAAATTNHARRHGIDFRHPLLDHRLLEFAARLPQTVVTDGFTQKAIVRRAMGSLLPMEVTAQFDKVRPTAIGYRGLREREQEKIWPLMRDMRLSDLGVVDESVLRSEYQAFLEGKDSTIFWYTITLEDWLRRYW